jgi:cellulose synthase/poly-beta-1,6-N-acetylglucosamine synthase-like glycosyltransferase
MMFFLFVVFTAFLAFFLVLPFLMLLISFFVREKIKINESEESSSDFACIITAFKNLEVPVQLVKSLLQQKYGNFHIYVVADLCENRAFPLVDERLTILYPPKPLKSKVKSMKYAVEHFTRAHDKVVIFDPDNLVRSDFLKVMNLYHQNGFNFVQGDRVAKNTDTTYARLDAAGEAYHNYADKFLPYLLGGSSPVSGSGMSIETGLFQKLLNDPLLDTSSNQVILGEDKIIQYLTNKWDTRIAYSRDAVIYDEKVSKRDDLQRQRIRWINTYFENVKLALDLILKGLIKFRFRKLFFGIVTIYPPLFLLVLGSIMVGLVALFFYPLFAWILLICMVIFGLNMFFTLYIAKTDKKVIAALFKSPIFILSQVSSLLQLRKARNDFLVTEKRVSISLDEIEKTKK